MNINVYIYLVLPVTKDERYTKVYRRTRIEETPREKI